MPPPVAHDLKAIKTTCLNRGTAFIPELGGCLNKDRADNLRRFRHITQGSSDIFSTYSTAFDVMQGAFNASGSDYIIHALGDKWRAHYNNILETKQPKYLTTIRDDFSEWAGWARRTNWDIYTTIIRKYRAIAQSDYNVLWIRSDTPIPLLPRGDCKQVGSSLVISPPSELKEPGYVGLRLSYRVSTTPLWRPPWNLKSYVRIHDGRPHWDGLYGIPSAPGAHQWAIPVEFNADDLKTGTKVLRLSVLPKGTNLTVTECSSEFSIPKSRFLAPADRKL